MKQPTPDLLLDWYDRHGRTLPWRVSPHDRMAGISPDPYRVWLSEVMLQQTTVAAVKAYFEKFTTRWPSLQDLAAAPREEVMAAWAGLGYYSRARNLKACADVLIAEHDGTFPTTVEGLKALPGIGDYTSAAIAAIAFDQPAVVVDGNVDRVMARLFALEDALPSPAAKKAIKAKAAMMTPPLRAGDYAQGVMDLGATICTPKKPTCALCPFMKVCAAFKRGDMELFPRKMPKKAKPTRYGAAFVAMRADGAVLLRKRANKGLLGGMTEIAGTHWNEGERLAIDFTAAPLKADWNTSRGIIKHTFTHFHLEVEVLHAEFPAETPAPQGMWWSGANAIGNEALPTVMKKILKAGAMIAL